MQTLIIIPEIFGVSIEVYIILIVLGIPIFFFWRFVFRKLIRSNIRSRRIATWIATAISTPLLYALIIIAYISYVSYYPSHKFDKVKWYVYKEKRYEMSTDLIKSRKLIGKSKSEIKDMLGIEYNNFGEDHWSYYLGYRPGMFNIDPDYLDIHFKDNKVIEVSQHES